MSVEIPLKVIYERVEEDDKEDQKEVSIDVSEESLKCKEKVKKRRCCVNCCACIGMFSCALILIYTILVLSMTSRLYFYMDKCFNSEDNIYQTSLIHSQIDRIHFDIVTGFVNVQFHNESFIKIRVWDNARGRSFIEKDTFDSGIVVQNSTIFIHSSTPAFNFRTCVHANVEIFVPYNNTHLSLSGIVKVGMVHIVGDSFIMNDIDIIVEVGKMEVENIISNSISLMSDIGYIELKHSVAANSVRLQTHTGFIRTYNIVTKNIHTLNLYGYSLHHSMITDNAKLDTKFGYSVIKNVAPFGRDLDLSVKTEYGDSKLTMDAQDLQFNLGNTNGHMMLKYESRWNCSIDHSSHYTMWGNCTVDSFSITSAKVEMNNKYGECLLIIKSVVYD